MLFKEIDNGSLTSPKGFMAGAVSAGLRDEPSPDLAIISGGRNTKSAGVFTKNQIVAPPVILSQRHLSVDKPRAIVVNSAIANAVVGKQGMDDAEKMASITAEHLGISMSQVLVCSTGVIGVPLPMDLISKGIETIELKEEGHEFARAILTTDTRTKEFAISVNISGTEIIISGTAKGSGMIHPDMATMLAFLTTDADISQECLERVLRHAVDTSFNMVTIDGDGSTNDSVIFLASGESKIDQIQGGEEEKIFQEAVNYVCTYLAKEIARDGEGATKLIEVIVDGAANLDEARIAARTIASSTLMKAAVYGNDPNWGRAVAALGRSGINFKESTLFLSMNGIEMLKQGTPVEFSKDAAAQSMDTDKVEIYIQLNNGDYSAISWTSDLTEEYVHINSAYTT
ncbi:MAG: bifunctional glutamate N-acetyltransferase/amino-acid acetyltransferase ArgJ [Dehalococcoidia bacterium]